MISPLKLYVCTPFYHLKNSVYPRVPALLSPGYWATCQIPWFCGKYNSLLLRCFCYWKNFESNQQSSSDQTADFGQVLYNWQLIVQNMYVIDIVLLSHVQQCHLKYWLLINTELFWIHEYSLFCTIPKCRYVPSSYLNHLNMYPPWILFKSWKINWACIDPVPNQGWVCNEPGPKTEKRWNKKADEDLLPSNILFFPLRYGCFNLSAMFSLHTKKHFKYTQTLI